MNGTADATMGSYMGVTYVMARSCLLPGIDGNLTYEVVVAGISALGLGETSPPGRFGPGVPEDLWWKLINSPPVAPEPPRFLAVEQTKVLVLWNLPLQDGGSPITGYRVMQRAFGSANWTVICNHTQNMNDTAYSTALSEFNGTTYTTARSCWATDLRSNTQYEFVVAGINVHGFGDYSQPALVLTAPTKPSPPGQVIAEFRAVDVRLSWARPSDDGGSRILGYEVAQETAKSGSFATLAIGGDISPDSFIVGGLADKTYYRFRTRAWNSVGWSPWGAASVAAGHNISDEGDSSTTSSTSTSPTSGSDTSSDTMRTPLEEVMGHSKSSMKAIESMCGDVGKHVQGLLSRVDSLTAGVPSESELSCGTVASTKIDLTRYRNSRRLSSSGDSGLHVSVSNATVVLPAALLGAITGDTAFLVTVLLDASSLASYGSDPNGTKDGRTQTFGLLGASMYSMSQADGGSPSFIEMETVPAPSVLTFRRAQDAGQNLQCFSVFRQGEPWHRSPLQRSTGPEEVSCHVSHMGFMAGYAVGGPPIIPLPCIDAEMDVSKLAAVAWAGSAGAIFLYLFMAILLYIIAMAYAYDRSFSKSVGWQEHYFMVRSLSHWTYPSLRPSNYSWRDVLVSCCVNVSMVRMAMQAGLYKPGMELVRHKEVTGDDAKMPEGGALAKELDDKFEQCWNIADHTRFFSKQYPLRSKFSLFAWWIHPVIRVFMFDTKTASALRALLLAARYMVLGLLSSLLLLGTWVSPMSSDCHDGCGSISQYVGVCIFIGLLSSPMSLLLLLVLQCLQKRKFRYVTDKSQDRKAEISGIAKVMFLCSACLILILLSFFLIIAFLASVSAKDQTKWIIAMVVAISWEVALGPLLGSAALCLFTVLLSNDVVEEARQRLENSRSRWGWATGQPKEEPEAELAPLRDINSVLVTAEVQGLDFRVINEGGTASRSLEKLDMRAPVAALANVPDNLVVVKLCDEDSSMFVEAPQGEAAKEPNKHSSVAILKVSIAAEDTEASHNIRTRLQDNAEELVMAIEQPLFDADSGASSKNPIAITRLIFEGGGEKACERTFGVSMCHIELELAAAMPDFEIGTELMMDKSCGGGGEMHATEMPALVVGSGLKLWKGNQGSVDFQTAEMPQFDVGSGLALWKDSKASRPYHALSALASVSESDEMMDLRCRATDRDADLQVSRMSQFQIGTMFQEAKGATSATRANAVPGDDQGRLTPEAEARWRERFDVPMSVVV